MRILKTMLATTALAVVALVASPTPLVAQTTTYTPLDCYQFGSYRRGASGLRGRSPQCQSDPGVSRR